MIDVSQWRAAIGSWNCRRVCSTLNHDLKCNKRLISSLTSNDHSRSSQSSPDDVDMFVWFSSVVSGVTPSSFCFGLYFMLHLILLLLLLSGDVELNPGPATVQQALKLVKESLQKNFARLDQATTYSIDGIRAELFSKGLISQSVKDSPTYNKIINEFKIGLSFMQDVSKLQERYETFLDCFSSQGGPAKDASDQLREEWTQIKQQIEKFNQKEDKQHDSLSDPHVKELSVALQVYISDLNKSGIDTQATLNHIKSRIESHFKMMLADGFSKDVLNKQLNDLTMNALIPSVIDDWCCDKLDELCKKEDKIVADESDTSSRDDLFEECPPLFSPDAVYHASLCNLIVNSEEGGQMLTKFGHTFDELSVSLSGKMKMLIAQQQNIVYVSFKDSKYDITIPAGDDDHAEVYNVELPLRYFVELLHQNKRIILTGFSFGGIAAWCVLIKCWNLPFFDSHFLQKNLHCIMFGLPSERPLDTIPGAQHCTDILESCSSFLLKDHLKQPHNFYLTIWDERDLPFSDFYNEDMTYLIYSSSNGLNYVKSPQNINIPYDNDDSTKSTMKVYHKQVLRGYLDRENYSVPPRKSHTGVVQSLTPSITEVELHHHKDPGGSEIAVAINGENLWFCNGINIVLHGNYSAVPINIIMYISAETVTQKKICYNLSLEKKQLPEEESTSCLVKVHSKFTSTFNADVPIFYIELDPISFRQSQLAKQTPSQIIQLSFLSALLEQSPSVHSGRPTKRYRQIVSFLQEVSSIVPAESAFFAIAETKGLAPAFKIVQAIVNAAQFSMPLSQMMRVGCIKALDRVFLDHDIRKLERECYSNEEFDEAVQNICEYNIPVCHEREAIYAPYVVRKATSLTFYNLHLIGNLIESFKVICQSIRDAAKSKSINLLSGRNIGEMYPISKAITSTAQEAANYSAHDTFSGSESKFDTLTPLPCILNNARKSLTDLKAHHKEAKLGTAAENNSMLKEVNKIIGGDLFPCVEMLGGFMEQQIEVPLVNNPHDTAKALSNSGAIGVWALFSLSQKDITHILSSRRNETLVIQIAKFIEGTLSEDVASSRRHDTESTTSYDAKLQFLLQGLKLQKTVTCSSNYISYSLERELVSICKECDITPTTKVDQIIDNWLKCFDKTALALVPVSHRPLLARWLVWALNIHELREGLASYTTVGVIGLVNSGKSTLVNKVFKIETIQGTTQSARTTVPFIYNLDSAVEGLSVIDFPGVDDRDKSIGGLAELLVGLAQIVIFVCAYDRFHTSPAMEWMEILQKNFADTPILVCLTQADRLYENYCNQLDMNPECPQIKIPKLKFQFENELKEIVSHTMMNKQSTVKFCSLIQSKFSQLNSDKTRQSMRNIGIFTPDDIDEWIEKALRRNVPTLADKFRSFINKTKI